MMDKIQKASNTVINLLTLADKEELW